MNIVVENGSYFMDNLGDVAMLQVCVRRIRDHWPDARITVISESPDRLREAVPGVHVLAPGHAHRIPMTSRTRHPVVVGLERQIQLRAPAVARWARRRQIAADQERAARYDAFHDALKGADAVVCSGGGYINDSHAGHTGKVLYTLAIAQGLGRPTAMFGAGLGPLEDPDRRCLARPVVRGLHLLALREREGNLEELQRWGGVPERTLVTGDDAVVLAREVTGGEADARQPEALGVSLRFARNYGLYEAPGLGDAVRSFCQQHGAPLFGLPVRTRFSPENDVDALRAVLGADAPDLEDAAAVETPAHLVRRAGRCRVVLTGTYHAGVFALSSGTPIVTLSGTAYYDRKFAGLAEQFGSSAVRSVRYADPDLPSRVRNAMDELWSAAPALRGPLGVAAERQVEKGRQAYREFFRLVERERGAGAEEKGPTP